MTLVPTFMLVLIGITLLIYFGLLLKISSSVKSSIFIEKVLIVFFILLIAGGWDKVGAFAKLSPNHILTEGQPPGLAFAAIVTTFSAALITLTVKLRVSSASFLSGLRKLVSHNPFLVILILLTPASALWSLTPFFTFARGVVFVAVITVGVYIASCYKWNEIFDLLKWSFALAMVQSAFIAMALPSMGIDSKGWQGAFSHAGILGLYAALTSLLWLIQSLNVKKDRVLSTLIFGMSLFVLTRTNSATGFVLFAQGLGLILAVYLMKKLRPKTGFLIMVNSLPITIILIQTLIYYLSDILISLDKSPDLTGRGEFWPQLIQKAIERPILGYGFEGFWLPWKGELNPAANVINSNFYIPSHAHNGFLDLTLSLGLLGLLLYTIPFIHCIARIFSSIIKSWDFAIIPLILLLFIFIANASGDGLWEVGFHSFLFVLIATRLTLDAVRA